jgi:hypothetical protein
VRLEIFEPWEGGLHLARLFEKGRTGGGLPPRVVIRLTPETSADVKELEKTFGFLAEGTHVEFTSDHDVKVSVVYPKRMQR